MVPLGSYIVTWYLLKIFKKNFEKFSAYSVAATAAPKVATHYNVERLAANAIHIFALHDCLLQLRNRIYCTAASKPLAISQFAYELHKRVPLAPAPARRALLPAAALPEFIELSDLYGNTQSPKQPRR